MGERSPDMEDQAVDDLALEALAEAHAAAPPRELRRRLLEAARRDTHATAAMRGLRRWRLVGSAAAALTLALAGLLAVTSREGSLRAERLEALLAHNQALATRLDAQAGELASVRAALESQAGVLRVVAGPRALVATLAPQPGVRGSGRMVVDATSGEAALLVSGLEPPPPGKTYELWAIRGDKPPEPAGLFSIGQEGWLAARMPPLHETAGITAFAVSVEPAGGSEAPSGPIVLTGGVTG